MSTYQTPLDRISLPPEGWRSLPSGAWVLARACDDLDRPGLFAHGSRRRNLELAERVIGSRLLDAHTVVELEAYGHRLKPVIYPPSDDMGDRIHCDRHDRAVAAQLLAWDRVAPVSRMGKPWVKLSTKERTKRGSEATIFGWAKVNGASSLASDAFDQWWQPLQLAHGLPGDHSDYSSLLWLMADSDLGAAESFATALVRMASAIPRAILRAFDMRPAHGYRCSVREAVDDSRALGTWHAAGGGYDPQVGDAIISARMVGGAVSDPTKGGNGHYEVVTSVAPLMTIGGNEGDTWTLAPYSLANPMYRGCIARGRAGVEAVRFTLIEYANKVRETPGPKHTARIQEYHSRARRGGSPLAGMPGHETEGAPALGEHAADEIAWCVSSGSFCLYEALSNA